MGQPFGDKKEHFKYYSWPNWDRTLSFIAKYIEECQRDGLTLLNISGMRMNYLFILGMAEIVQKFFPLTFNLFWFCPGSFLCLWSYS